MPEPVVDPDEEAEIQAMLLSLLTNRQDAPAQETSELESARGAKASQMMGSAYWGGEPMYYTPASAYNYTDQAVQDSYQQRLVHDAEHARRPEDMFYRDAWEQDKQEKMGHPDWAYPKGTPPWWPAW